MRVERSAVPLYRPPRWWERLAAFTGLGVMTVVFGAVVATLTGGLIWWTIDTLTGKLK